MEVKMFYKTQREIAEVINEVIDGYWEDKIPEDDMIEKVTLLYENNSSKIIKDEDFTTILKQQCGKRRLEIIGKLINMNIE